MSAEAPVLEFPGRERRVYSIYDLFGSWNFDIENVDPVVQATGDSIKQLLVDPDIWQMEACGSGLEKTPYEDSYKLKFSFYAPSRERAGLRKSQLALDLRKVVRPDIVEEFYFGGGASLGGKFQTEYRLKRMDIPPFTTDPDAANPTFPHAVQMIKISDFPIYLNRLNREGTTEYRDPAYDPRRLIAELYVKDITAEQFISVSGKEMRINEVINLLEQNAGKLSADALEDLSSKFRALAARKRSQTS